MAKVEIVVEKVAVRGIRSSMGTAPSSSELRMEGILASYAHRLQRLGVEHLKDVRVGLIAKSQDFVVRVRAVKLLTSP
jgi:hypothetical protein